MTSVQIGDLSPLGGPFVIETVLFDFSGCGFLSLSSFSGEFRRIEFCDNFFSHEDTLLEEPSVESRVHKGQGNNSN